MLPMPPSTAAVKAFEAGEEAHPEVDVRVEQALRDAGDGGEESADGERDHDDAVDVDTHEPGGVGASETACIP